MITERDTCGPNYNFDIFRDECDSKIHFQGLIWWFGHKKKTQQQKIERKGKVKDRRYYLNRRKRVDGRRSHLAQVNCKMSYKT
jgi:hypothetical protein